MKKVKDTVPSLYAKFDASDLSLGSLDVLKLPTQASFEVVVKFTNSNYLEGVSLEIEVPNLNDLIKLGIFYSYFDKANSRVNLFCDEPNIYRHIEWFFNNYDRLSEKLMTKVKNAKVYNDKKDQAVLAK